MKHLTCLVALACLLFGGAPPAAAAVTRLRGLIRGSATLHFSLSNGNKADLEGLATRPVRRGRFPPVIIDQGFPRDLCAVHA